MGEGEFLERGPCDLGSLPDLQLDHHGTTIGDFPAADHRSTLQDRQDFLGQHLAGTDRLSDPDLGQDVRVVGSPDDRQDSRAPHLVRLHPADDVVRVMAGAGDKHAGGADPGLFELAASCCVGVENGGGVQLFGEPFAAFLVALDQRHVEMATVLEHPGKREADFTATGDDHVLSRRWLVLEDLADRVEFAMSSDQSDTVTDRDDIVGRGDHGSFGVGDQSDQRFTGKIEFVESSSGCVGVLLDGHFLHFDSALGEVFQGQQARNPDLASQCQGGQVLETDEPGQSEVVGNIEGGGVQVGRVVDP